MQTDERDLLDVLKSELAFLEKGGYGRSPREPWKQPLIFEDSPSCMNYDSREHPGPCSDCVLMELVPLEFRGKQIPCRHVPFTVDGETLASLSEHARQFEIEDVFGKWLRATIASIEESRQSATATPTQQAAPGSAGTTGDPIQQKLQPKCSNPACPTAFRWLAGGKFFRFRPEPGAAKQNSAGTASVLGIAGVEHFWLCEHCSHVFTLVFEDGKGVMLKLLWPELLAVEPPKQLTAS